MKISIKKEDVKGSPDPERLALSLRNGRGRIPTGRAKKRQKDQRNHWSQEWA